MPAKPKKILPKKGSKTSKKQKSLQERLEVLSTIATEWLGSNASLFIHTIFFAGSFSLVYFGVPIIST